MKHFYVYYSYEEWGRGYIGKRECRCLPEEDVKYFGSFKDKSFKPTQKIILATFDSKQKAIEAEIMLHNFYEVDVNKHFANRAKQTAVKFSYDRTGHRNSEEWRQRMTGDNHPSKRTDVREKLRQGQLKWGENHSSRRPEGRERARQIFSGDHNPNSSPEGRERCRKEMSKPERKEMSRQNGSKNIKNLMERNPNHQSDAGKKCHIVKDENGKSIHALKSYYKGLGLRDEHGNLIYPPPKINELRYYDPDHPELGVRSPGTLAKMQKARGYSHGKENRVKVTNDEPGSS